MNLQRLIDQHPFAASGDLSDLLPLVVWLLVGATISVIGGWSSLAKVYRTEVAFDGTENGECRSGQMRWLANYNNGLTIGVSQLGLAYLASMFLFSVHAPSATCSMERDQGS